MTGFLTPDNEFIDAEYSNLQEVCKKICKESKNQKDFLSFSKGYTNFSPYFDFVVFHLKYVFIGPLLEDKLILADRNGSLINLEMDEFIELHGTVNYQNVMNVVNLPYYQLLLPYINPCSDKELRCRSISNSRLYSSMITNQGMMMMSTTGFDQRGSHGVTALTLLNMMLIENPEMLQELQLYIQNGGGYNNFLLEICGYLHFVSKKEGGLILVYGDNHSPIIRKFLSDREKEGYIIKDISKKRKERIA